MPDDAAATVRQFEILHGGEEHLGLHLDSLCKQLPGARSKDIRQGIIDLVGLTKPNNTAILIHGVSLSLRGSGRLDTRLDTPPISHRHHPVSCLARSACALRSPRTTTRAIGAYGGAYPACWKWLAHSCGVKACSASPTFPKVHCGFSL